MAKKQMTSWADFFRMLARTVIVVVVMGTLVLTFTYGVSQIPEQDNCYVRTEVATTTPGTDIVKIHNVPCE